MKKCLVATLVALGVSALFAEGIGIITTGAPNYPTGGCFYGYRSSGSGPGDTAFDDALALAVKNHALLFIVWGKDGCSTCSTYISNLDEASRAAPKMLSYKNTINAYFRGKSDGTGPAACVSCYNFLRNTVGASGNCHIMAAYGVCEDGTVYAKSCSLITDYTTSGKKKVAWCDEFEALKEKHRYTPPKASAAFACSQLELVQGAGVAYVPFERTNCLDKAEENVLKVIKGEETLSTNKFTWSANQSRLEIPLNLDWAKDCEYKLVLVNTNNEDVVTNMLKCVAAEPNGFANPRFIGETNGCNFGEWTLDLDAATGGVWAANSYSQADTGTVHAVEVSGSRQSFDWSTSNRYDTVYTNDYKFFASEDRGIGHGPQGARKWTENVTWEFDFAATNLNTTIFTNDIRFFEQMKVDETPIPKQHFEYVSYITHITNYVDVAESVGETTDPVDGTWTGVVTNRFEYEISADGLETNLLATVTNQFTTAYAATNVTVSILTNAAHKAVGREPEVIVERITNVYDYDEGKNVYYKDSAATDEVEFPQTWECVTTNRVVTNYVAQAEEILPDATNKDDVAFQYLATKQIDFIVSPDKAETNLWGEAETESKTAQFYATNIVHYARTNETHRTACSVTNDCQVLTNAVAFTGKRIYHTTSATAKETFDVSFKTNYPSAREYAVNFDATPAVTNLVASNPVEKNYKITATNCITYVWSDTPSSTTKLGDLVPDSFTEDDTDTYYDVTWDASPVEWEDQSQGYCETNRVYYVFNGSTTTNVCDAEQTVVSTNTIYIATNYAHWVYSATQTGVVTRYDDYCANAFTLALTNTYARVETNDYQYGYNETIEEPDFGPRHGRSDKGVQAFALVVSGASTTDAKLLAYAQQVFATTNFAQWAASNNVSLVLLDCTNGVAGSAVGQGLLTHNHAGTNCYVSGKGLRAYAETEPVVGDEVALSAEEMQEQLDMWNADYRKATANEMEIILVRPDGVAAGTLTPQFNKNGTCDVAENLKRLAEFLRKEYDCDLAVDPSEPLNNTTNATPLSVTFNQEGSGDTMYSLQISDTHDFFKVEGLQADVPFAVELDYYRELSSTMNEPQFDVAGGCRQLASNVWVATAAQIQAGVYLDVYGWTSAQATTGTFGGNTVMYYDVAVKSAPENVGTIGFDGNLNPREYIGAERSVAITVSRQGYTGQATAKVSVDTDNTTVPAECYTWTDTNLVWGANESGTQTVYVSLKDVRWNRDIKNLVFKVEAEGAKADAARTQLVIAVSQKIRDGAFTGTVAITDPDVGEKLYASANHEVEIGLCRAPGVYQGEDEARGAVVATMKTAFGEFVKTNEVTWAEYEYNVRKALTLRIGDLGNLASKEFKVSMSALDVDTNRVDIAGSNAFTVVAIPSDSTKFLDDIDETVAQYVAIDKTAYLEKIPDGMTVVSAVKISGTTAAGVTYAADKTTGGIRVSGTPTKAGVYESCWWIRLKRSNGTYAYTMPVNIRLQVRALGTESEEGGEPLNPGFASARSWTGLPVVDTVASNMVGTLDITVAKNGRFSARYHRTGGKTVAFSASALSSVDVDTGLATVFAQKTVAGVIYTIYVEFAADGSLNADISDPAYGEDLEVSLSAGSGIWSKTNTAGRWGGNYVAAFSLGAVTNDQTLCLGPVTMRLRFDAQSQWNTGKVIYQGYLPNGNSISGSASLVPVAASEPETTLAIFFSNSRDTFSALPVVSSEKTMSENEDVIPYCSHIESGCTAGTYANDYPSFAAVSWDSSVFSGFSGRYKIGAVGVLTYSINRSSGIVNGTYRDSAAGIPSAVYRGVAVGDDKRIAIGACTWNEKIESDAGKMKSVKAGMALDIMAE